MKVQILGDPQSKFNQTTRYDLGRYQFARSLLGMHSYGDAREWYLKPGSPIVIEAVTATGAGMDDKAFNNFVQDVKEYTGREVSVFNTEKIPGGVLSDADLGEIASKYRRHVLSGQANLFVIYAQDFKRSGTEIGKTFQEYGIVLSDKRLREVTADFPQAMAQYVESTLLHEFGHQIGLDHNSEPDCIMNERVEKPEKLNFFSSEYTNTKFCNFELGQLSKIKATIK